MHPKYQKAHNWSREVIGAAMEVHRTVGPGLLESVYERCLLHELTLRGIPVSIETPIAIRYKDLVLPGANLDETLLPSLASVQQGEC